MAELERVAAGARGELVDQQLAEQRRLRHAEAAERAGDAVVGEHGARQRAHVGDAVRAAGVDRHPVGDGRSPRRIGAGVEVAGEVEGDEAAVGVARRARLHRRRMALGARLHRLGPLVDQAHRAAELPGGDRDQRLHREVELAAEAAADRRRHDVHLLGRDLQHARDLVAVHVGRLRAGEDADAAQRRAACVDAAPRRSRRSPPRARCRRARRDASRRSRWRDAMRRRARRRRRRARRGRGRARCRGSARAAACRARPRRARRRSLRARRAACSGSARRRRRSRPASPRRRRARAPPRRESARRRRRAPAGRAGRRKIANALFGTSAALTTSTMPGQRARKAARSPTSKRACACGERIDAHRQHRRRPQRGSASAPKRSLPVTLAGASSRATRAPTACPARDAGDVDDRARRDGEHRLDDLAVAGAAAQHAGERVADLGLGRLRVRAQQRLGAHQHARRADAALRRAVGDEGALQRRQRAVGAGEAFDRRHRAAVALADADDARAHLLAVEQHGAGAAVAGVAADLGAGQAELVAQGVGEAPARVAGELARAAVDVDAHDLDRRQVARGHRRLRARIRQRARAGRRAHGAATSRRARRTSVAVASRR